MSELPQNPGSSESFKSTKAGEHDEVLTAYGLALAAFRQTIVPVEDPALSIDFLILQRQEFVNRSAA